MKIFFMVFSILLMANQAISQNIESQSQIFQRKNSFNIELGGYCALGSINYERVLINRSKFKTTGQIGYGYLGVPIFMNQLVSFRKHHLEFGLGVVLPVYQFGNDQEASFISGRIGYRFQKPSGNFIFRAGLMPVALGYREGGEADMFLWAWPGLSFGWTF